MSILISVGRWGGVYFERGFTWRLCLGWIAVTYIPLDDDWIDRVLETR